MNNRSGIADRVVVADRGIDDAAELFGLLSDPGRLRLLASLRAGESNVTALAAANQMSESATSHALRLLRAHRVVDVRRTGRMAFYRLTDGHVSQLVDTVLAHAAHVQPVRVERGSDR